MLFKTVGYQTGLMLPWHMSWMHISLPAQLFLNVLYFLTDLFVVLVLLSFVNKPRFCKNCLDWTKAKGKVLPISTASHTVFSHKCVNLWRTYRRANSVKSIHKIKEVKRKAGIIAFVTSGKGWEMYKYSIELIYFHIFIYDCLFCFFHLL